jgi:hypothetical protein
MSPYPTYSAFVEGVVLPARKANPDHQRLDGWSGGGNREVAGRFMRDGRVWKVHADSRYEPLLLAYESERVGGEPFRHDRTKNGDSLVLVDELEAQRQTPFKHLYIYGG